MKTTSPSFGALFLMCLAVMCRPSMEVQFNGTLTREILSSWTVTENIETVGTLNLTQRGISELANGVFLTHWTHITSVNLQFNQLKALKANQFQGLTGRVTNLNLSHNQLEWLDPQAFRSMFHLQNIDLSHNKLTSRSDQAFGYFSYVSEVNLAYNSYKNAPNARFKSLHHLNMSHNQIERVDGWFFDYISVKWAVIGFSFNQIKYIDYKRINANCLSDVDIKGNPVEANFTISSKNWFCKEFTPVNYRDPTGSQKFNLTTWKLKEWKVYENRSQIRLLDLSSKAIQSIDHEVLAEYERLNYLHLENNEIERIESKQFYSLGYSLLELYLGCNHLNSLSSDIFKGLEKLQVLSLGGNQIDSINSSAFNDLKSLIWLYLNSNRLKFIYGSFFTNQGGLRFLDLSDNVISILERSDFTSLNSLTNLNLSANAIYQMDGDFFADNKDLVRLDLSRNNFIDILGSEKLNELCLQELDLADNNLRKLKSEYDQSTGCIVVKEQIGPDRTTPSWETATVPLFDAFTEESPMTSHPDNDPESELTSNKSGKTLSTVLIIFIAVLACGLVFFLLFIISLKVRAQRAARLGQWLHLGNRCFIPPLLGP